MFLYKKQITKQRKQAMKNNRKSMIVACVSLVLTSFAIEMPKDAEKDGGIVKLSGAGRVATVVCCDLDAKTFQPALDLVDSLFHLELVAVRRTTFALGDATALLTQSGANAAVFLVDDATLPYSLVAPEAKWGLVNVAALKMDKPSQPIFARRVNLLFMRTICRVLGSDAARSAECCNFPAFDLKGLDGIKGLDPAIEAFINVNESMKHLGLEQTVWGTYRDACEMEMAPPPTNALQRAIADEVKRLLAKEKAKNSAHPQNH